MDVKKDDGFAALHLAALNGHREVARTLITVVSRPLWALQELFFFPPLVVAHPPPHYSDRHCCCCVLQGRADMEIRNNRQQTPLLLAVSQGHIPLILLLINEGSKHLLCFTFVSKMEDSD